MCDYTLGCSFLNSTSTPCMASTDRSMFQSGQIQPKSLFWLVEFLSPVHHLVQSQGSAGHGLQLELEDRVQQLLEMCLPIFQAETFWCQTQQK